MKKSKHETVKTKQEPIFTYTQVEKEDTSLEQMFFRLFEQVMKKHTNNN